MRITLNLDDDVAARLEAERRRGTASLKTIINEGLRRGLPAAPVAGIQRGLFQTAVWDAGEIKIAWRENIAEVIAVAEGEDFK